MKAVKYIVFFGNFYQVIVYDFFKKRIGKIGNKEMSLVYKKAKVFCFVDGNIFSGF